jgi:selenium-binding protein 1
MKHLKISRLVLLIVGIALLSACQKSEDLVPQNETNAADIALKSAHQSNGFVHAPVVNVYGENYYFAGAPDGPNGATDIPGHYWNQAGPKQLVGKHYNTGPFGSPQWWSSDAPDGELLYLVHAIIDEWSEMKSGEYAAKGYVHYHELVSVADGTKHPTLVVWLKHTARTTFTLDGGPHPELAHEVSPGVDLEFIPNGRMPYSP